MQLLCISCAAETLYRVGSGQTNWGPAQASSFSRNLFWGVGERGAVRQCSADFPCECTAIPIKTDSESSWPKPYALAALAARYMNYQVSESLAARGVVLVNSGRVETVMQTWSNLLYAFGSVPHYNRVLFEAAVPCVIQRLPTAASQVRSSRTARRHCAAACSVY